MTNNLEELSTLITKTWQQGKYHLVLKQLSKLPKDVVLEVLVCAGDDVTPTKRLGLLEKMDEDLVSDGDVLALLGL